MDVVHLTVDEGVGVIRLERPPMNAIDRQLTEELAAAAAEVGNRADVAAVVLTGGPKVFAAGADIKQMGALSYPQAQEWGTFLQRTFDQVARIPKPVVAAVSGYALGGGMELALTADFRILGDNARVGQPEILLGIIPGAGGTQRLARLVGPAKAKDLIFTGRHVRAPEALELGIADKVVAPDDVETEAIAYARTFVGGPAVALRAAKQAIDDGLGLDLDAGLRLETALFTALFATEDQRDGMASFLENGPGKATFHGR